MEIFRSSRAYKSWIGMRQRCYKKTHHQYHNYGGRGITVCERWRNSFENFANDMGEAPTRGHTLDRIDNNGNYEPGNCRWATPKEQCNNTRVNRYVEWEGKRYSVSQLAEHVGMKPSLLFSRLYRGVPLETAIKKARIPHPIKAQKYPFNEKMLTIREISTLTGLKTGTIYSRLHDGLSLEESFNTALRPNHPEKKILDEFTEECEGLFTKGEV